MRSKSQDKWLEVHGIEHWTEFYTDYGVEIQKRFFGHFLKDEDTGWKKQPKVSLLVRSPGEEFEPRAENEWPLARTEWTKLYLHGRTHSLFDRPAASERQLTYGGFSDGVTFMSPPMDEDTEITGPIAAKLFVSSASTDADLFLVFRVFTPDLQEVTFIGALDPHTPIAQGWLRASHRKLDEDLSLPYRPYHTHDEKLLLTPGEIYELDIEVWPTCINVPKGYRVALSVRGKDYEWPGGKARGLGNLGGETFTGVGPFKHNDPQDRPADVFGADVTLHVGPEHEAHILLPFIPKK